MAKSKKSLTRGADFTRTYDLHGVGDDLSELVNMYVDYEGDGDGIETIPGFRRILSLGSNINGLFRQKLYTGMEYLIIQAGTELYRIPAKGEGVTEKIASLNGIEPTAFTHGESLYILDGKAILELSPDGEVKSISQDPYVPTTYKNGSPYEERNLLTCASYQEYDVGTAEEFTYGSACLLYSISDYKERKCAVSGVDKTKAESLYVPSYKYIGGVRYAVTEILPHALEDSLITELTVAEGITKIGENAVRDCKNLRRVILPSSISEIERYAFTSATLLEYVRLGMGLAKIGAAVFADCPALKTVCYEGSSAQLESVEGVGALDGKAKQYNVTYNTATVAFSTHGYGFTPQEVSIDGEDVEFGISDSGEVILRLDYKSDIEGKRVRISGIETKNPGMRCELGADLVARYQGMGPYEEAIYGCKLATVFDGRVFLSGNPRFPGIVFYSTDNIDGENSPRYFGSYDFFGTGSSYPVSSLIPSSDALIVTKAGEAGEGSILTYKRGRTLTSPRSTRYTRSDAYMVTGGISHATVYSGIPLFLLGDRLYRLSGSPKSLTPVTNKLGLAYASEDIFSLEWLGYLFLSDGEKCLLVDNRGEGGYRIYPLSDIGSYKNSKQVYVYADSAAPGLSLSDKEGEVLYESVMSESDENGETHYYVTLGGVKVAVSPTEEMEGGTFYPARCALSIGKLLYFGTDAGDVCLFNNDKRGIAPSRIKNAQGFDNAEYERSMAGKIHPDFYDFMGHRIHYSLATVSDVCDDPTVYKRTCPEGIVIEASSESCIPLSYVEVCDGAEKKEAIITHGPFDFSNLDFSALCFLPAERTSLSLSGEATTWVRHGIKIREAAYRSPTKIISLSLGYRTYQKIIN